MRRNWKKFAAVFAVAAFTLSAASCTGLTLASNAEASETGRTDIHLRMADAFSTLDPHNTAMNSDFLLNRQIYEPLYALNDASEEIPMLATEYTVSDDGLTWTFKLRDGVTFQNGNPLKASDVVYSYERAMASSYMAEKTEAIESVNAVDDSTVELHLKYQFAPLVEKISEIMIVNEEYTEANKDDQGLLGFNACGTGAYQVTSAVPDVSVSLESYEDYWGGAPAIKSATYELITDDTTAITSFEAGEIDMMGIPSANWAEMSTDDTYNSQAIDANHVTYLILNTQAAPFDNLQVRQAISYAINRQDVIDMSVDGLASAADTLATSYMFGYTEDHTSFDYDVEKAKELLSEAGYADGLDIGSIKVLSGTYFEKVAQVVQGELAEIGVTCTIEGMDGNSLIADCMGGNIGMSVMGQTNGMDYDFMKTYYGTDYIDSLNMARYSNEEVDKLFDEGASTTDKDARLDIYKQIEEIVQNDCAYVPLYNRQTLYAWNKDLNYTPSVTYYHLKDITWN